MFKILLSIIFLSLVVPIYSYAGLPYHTLREVHEDKGYLDRDYTQKKYREERLKYQVLRMKKARQKR